MDPMDMHRRRSDVARGISSAEALGDGEITGWLSFDQDRLADFIFEVFTADPSTSLAPDCADLTALDHFMDVESIIFIGLCFPVEEINEMDEGCQEMLMQTPEFIGGERLPARWMFHPAIREVVFCHEFIHDKQFARFLQAYHKLDGDTAPPPENTDWPPTPTLPINWDELPLPPPPPMMLSPPWPHNWDSSPVRSPPQLDGPGPSSAPLPASSATGLVPDLTETEYPPWRSREVGY